ncbi:MAG: FxLYD domain-containing protein [Chloroflexota bacterium]
MKRLVLWITLGMVTLPLLLLLAACDANPVVVVATPVPPDAAFRKYQHPSGVFSLRLPPDWSVRDVSRADSIRVEFSPPSNNGLPMTVYVVNTGTVLDSPALLDAINKYQAVVNGDAQVYNEVGRNAQGDGSWRLAGVRQTPIGPRQLNTFMQADKTFISAIEVDVTGANEAMLQTLRTVINTYRVDPTAVINASAIQADSAGVTTTSGVLAFGGLYTWTNNQGTFIVNGQVTNKSGGPLEAIRVSALLYDAQNNPVAEQANVIPIEVLADGGITPFTVQFKSGKPSQAVRLELQAAGRNAEYALKTHLGDDQFIKGNDKATYNAGGYLTIGGDVVNRTQGAAHFVKATITVYDDQQRVVATDSAFVTKPDLLPGDSARFEVTFFEIGGSVARYVITVEGKSDG